MCKFEDVWERVVVGGYFVFFWLVIKLCFGGYVK